MANRTIALVIGSLRKESFNRKLAEAMIRLAPDGWDFDEVRIGDLPLYDQDDDGNEAEPVRRLKQQVRASDGVLLFTPEYNRSIPGVLKNALDCGSRPYGDSAWQGKPAGIVSVSIGAPGGAMAQQHLRNVLAYLDMPTLNQPEAYIQHKDGLYDADGNIGEASRDFLQGWMDAYVAWVERHAG
ncbi:NADPH-dependent FMN reductase [Novilysobacter defluvii]|nr:NAD(P)H-dependent oxidoreductase [Lysobacter defluvii]